MSDLHGLVVDPFMGVGTTAVAAFRHGRRAAGAERVSEYYDQAVKRLHLEARGELRTRPMGKEVYRPSAREVITRNPFSGSGDGKGELGLED